MKKLLLSVTLITSPLLITSETCDEKFAKLGSFEPIVTSTQSVGANSGMLNSLSTFSGWGGPVGTKNPFNYFEFNVDPWDKMNPITQVRVRILEKNSTGKVLIDELQNINLIAGGGSQKIKFILPKPVTSSSNLYFEFYTNGRTGREETILIRAVSN
jgi:hypothetical protein